MDSARKQADGILDEIEKRIEKEYSQAVTEIEERLNKHFADYQAKDATKRKALEAGEITKKEYNQWRSNQFLTGERWKDLRDTLAEDLVNKQAIAKSIANGYMPEVYALSHNYVVENVADDLDFKITFSLYDKNTVENLMKHNDILPAPGKRMQAKFARGEAVKWERGQIQSVAMQSIMQGESIPKMSKRIAQTLGVRNTADSIRYARTACTGAENKGRLDGMRHLEDDGIVLHKQWTATADDRTRASHLDIDGESVPPEEEFSNGLMYPGDPGGAAEEVWNCRCSMGTIVLGFRREDGSISRINYEREADAHDIEIAAERDRRSGNETIGGIAQSTLKAARDAEKYVTRDLKRAVSKGNGHLEGLDFRFKGRGSLQRKIVDKSASKGISQKEYAQKITDALRYTNISTPENLTQDYMTIVGDLEKKGYSMAEVSNTLKIKDAQYRGINTLVRTPDGYVFELQFHTPQSVEIKEVNHKLYEVQRLASTSEEEKIKLGQEMSQNALSIETPKNIDSIVNKLIDAPIKQW